MAVLIVTIIVVAALERLSHGEQIDPRIARKKRTKRVFPNRLRVSAGDFGSSSRLTSRWSGRGNRRSRELGLEV